MQFFNWGHHGYAYGQIIQFHSGDIPIRSTIEKIFFDYSLFSSSVELTISYNIPAYSTIQHIFNETVPIYSSIEKTEQFMIPFYSRVQKDIKGNIELRTLILSMLSGSLPTKLHSYDIFSVISAIDTFKKMKNINTI